MHSMTRRIAPGGLLFLTTPFAEILAENEVYCPSCDHFFHRWQHQRSWELADIEGLMKRWGLATEWLGRVGFDDPHCVRDFHLRRRCGEPWPWLIGKEVPLIGRGDHIVYIGRKPSDGPAVMSTSAQIKLPVLTEAGAKGVVAGGVVASSLDQGKAPIDNPENDVFAEARSEAHQCCRWQERHITGLVVLALSSPPKRRRAHWSCFPAHSPRRRATYNSLPLPTCSRVAGAPPFRWMATLPTPGMSWRAAAGADR